jgi:aarF domain-containing kinase
MIPANGWARVAMGVRLVAADGAWRILASTAEVSSNVTNRHLPELVDSFAKAVAAAQQSSYSAYSRSTKGEVHRTKQPNNDLTKPLDSSMSIDTQTMGGQIESTSKNLDTQELVHGRRIDAVDDGGRKFQSSCNEDTNEKTKQPNNNLIDSPTSIDPQTMGVQYETSNMNSDAKSAEIDNDEQYAEDLLPEGSAVPTSRISRALGFASLGAGLALGSVAELARRTLGRSKNDTTDPLVLSNDANAQRLTDSLRRMRGAAMKLGQMLSIQDESIAPPALTNALEVVRRGAEAMPKYQLMQQLDEHWGGDWRERIELEDRPFAAASIGQVHRGTLLSRSTSSSTTVTKVAVKVQYPGVADSIESDLANLSMLINATGLAPPGLFLENVIRVGREELKVECDYMREVTNQKRFRSLISSDPSLVADRFVVPEVIEEMSTNRILVTELVRGGTIDKVVNLDQSERNRIGLAIMRLTMLELFVWRFMQTDPNWGNFLYDVRTRTTYLIDFGASREFSVDFVGGYLNIVLANANRDVKSLLDESIRMGFLTGEENDVMLEAHKLSGFCLGEPFQSYEPYDFKSSKITSRISEHGSVFLRHRLVPPPEEVYTLHRKLAGAYNLCIKLGAKISCRGLLDEVAAIYKK